MTCHYPDLGSASDWLNQISYATQPIRSTTQIWVKTRHQYGISSLTSQTSFAGKPVVALPNVGCFLRLVIRRPRCISMPQRVCTPNCNKVVIEKKQKAKSQIGVNSCIYHCLQHSQHKRLQVNINHVIMREIICISFLLSF